MSDQVPKCRKRVFNCLDCDEREDCKDWFIILEDERARSAELVELMPILVKHFGFCGLTLSSIEECQEMLGKMGFGC